MQAAACCLTAHGLRVPVASACPPQGLEQGARTLPLWRPWLPRAQEGPAPRQEEMDALRGRGGGSCWVCGTPVPARAAGARYHLAVSPQARARAAEGHGGPSKALAFFQHPVRLLWPKSKAFDHLYSVGEKLLENFPVQATLFFYEDSGSEEEEDEEEEEEREDEEVEATGDVTAGHPRNADSLGPSGPA
ncbi:protein ripply1 [Serinus canaria]|uniref:protein ripply1 n=1 Tax=Serinus canaria TaxID=9135 RepID=UPI0021CD01FC|nr:protein ripply1 [Serinus canaria]